MGIQNLGTVIAFDENAGCGSVRDGNGRELFFHCTAIVDGSRTIDIGDPVAFTIRPGHGGQYEASAIAVCTTRR